MSDASVFASRGASGAMKLAAAFRQFMVDEGARFALNDALVRTSDGARDPIVRALDASFLQLRTRVELSRGEDATDIPTKVLEHEGFVAMLTVDVLMERARTLLAEAASRAPGGVEPFIIDEGIYERAAVFVHHWTGSGSGGRVRDPRGVLNHFLSTRCSSLKLAYGLVHAYRFAAACLVGAVANPSKKDECTGALVAATAKAQVLQEAEVAGRTTARLPSSPALSHGDLVSWTNASGTVKVCRVPESGKMTPASQTFLETYNATMATGEPRMDAVIRLVNRDPLAAGWLDYLPSLASLPVIGSWWRTGGVHTPVRQTPRRTRRQRAAPSEISPSQTAAARKRPDATKQTRRKRTRHAGRPTQLRAPHAPSTTTNKRRRPVLA